MIMFLPVGVHFNTVDLERILMCIVTIIAITGLTARYIRSYKRSSRGQKLFIAALIFALITNVWDAWDLILNNDHFSWRILPALTALVLVWLYLLDPYSTTVRRLGHDPFDAQTLEPQDLKELRALRAEKEELKNLAYDLARRNNDLRLKQMLHDQDTHHIDKSTEILREGNGEQDSTAQEFADRLKKEVDKEDD